MTTHTGDLKELIPEFYLPIGFGNSSKQTIFLRRVKFTFFLGNFLLNSDDLKLGRRQDGTWLGDVELPAWASGMLNQEQV